MKPSETIEKMFTQTNIETNTDVDKVVLGDAVDAMSKSKQKTPVSNELDVWRIIMKSKITKLAVAAVIIIAVLIGINRFGGSVDLATVAWGKVEEAMKELPYIHIVSKTYAKGSESISQSWFNFREKKSFAAFPDGYLWSWDHNNEREYFYGPDTKKLTICYMWKDEVGRFDSAYSFVDTIIDKMQEEGATVSYQKSELNSEEVLIAEVSKEYPDGNMFFGNTVVKQVNFKLIVNQKTNLTIAGEIDHLDVNDVVVSHAKLKINYPQKGPIDIYDIGVPKEASVFYSTKTANQVKKELVGPTTHVFPDGSTVQLEKGAKIGLYHVYHIDHKRGLEHIAGEIEVSVAKGKSEFVVATSFGAVKALGTVFKMDLVNTESIDILAVKVKEGSIEISNPQGSSVIKANQGVTVERDTPPYDFRQDEKISARLKERIDSMLTAIETGDKKAYCANYNLKAYYDLIKGKIKFEDHRDWFSGMSDDDAKRIIEGMADVKSPEELAEMMLSGISDKTHKLYVCSVTLSSNNQHAVADCVERHDNRTLRLTPQWTYFRDDWWQTDD